MKKMLPHIKVGSSSSDLHVLMYAHIVCSNNLISDKYNNNNKTIWYLNLINVTPSSWVLDEMQTSWAHEPTTKLGLWTHIYSRYMTHSYVG